MARYKCDICKQYEIESVDIPTRCEHCGISNGAWKNLDTNKIEQKSSVHSKVIHKAIPDKRRIIRDKPPPKKKLSKPIPKHKSKVVTKPKTIPKTKVTSAPKTIRPIKSTVYTDPLFYEKSKLKKGIAKMFIYALLIFPFVGFFIGLFIFCIIYKIFFVEVNWTNVLINWTIFTGMFGAVIGFIRGYKG